MNFSQREEQILKYWKEKDIFKKSIDERPVDRRFVFYDGPPFATGLPHYGHLVGGVMKDVIPRYWTMKGYRVPRRWGWDCHGLPVEYEVEKELKISGKKDIEEKIGIDKFNDFCRSIVLRYTREWEKTIERTGRWVDMNNAYRTMDIDYMESIWWVFKKLYEKDLIYQGYKILPFCPRCSTPLSNFEANMPGSYKDVTDPAITLKFKVTGPSTLLRPNQNIYILVWTTTPWTLPSNSGLAVGSEIKYVKVKDKLDGDIYILAADRLGAYYKNKNEPARSASPARIATRNVAGGRSDAGGYEILEEVKGADLVGLKYEPLFPYFINKESEGAFRVVTADFVAVEEGTGIVHIAPGFGEDDYNLGQKQGLPIINPIDETGCFDKSVPDYAGMFIKKADEKIMIDLKEQGKLVKRETITHSYPHCWRCETPLIYKAVSTWFVAVTKIKGQMVKNNQQIHWIPEHLKEGRFGKWLEDAKDWAISRNRYWGTPLPIWVCQQCGRKQVIGSIEELKPYFANRNRFFLLRHGLAEHNARKIVDSRPNQSNLTKEGQEKIRLVAEALKKEGVTKIITSPITRARQTAEMLADVLKVPIEQDERLWEIRMGAFNGKAEQEYHAFFNNFSERWIKRPEDGEAYPDVSQRMLAVVRDYNSRYRGETIVIVSHGDPIWLLMAALLKKDKPKFLEEVPYLEPGAYKEIVVSEIDLHCPWIDQIELSCECGGKMRRISEVLDCWFESGAMPYAQNHYPFENKEIFEDNFPAHFIAEGIDQTRGWFYTLLVISTALFNKQAFLNVAVNGLVLAEDGKKMSKRLKNYPEPEEILNKYGADALRYYLLNSPVVRGETLCFSEKGVREVLQKILMLFENVFNFYQIYAIEKASDVEPKSKHILDKWILTKLNFLIKEVTENLDNYDLMKAVRPFAGFVDDFSTWYLRRSRKRLKGEGGDKEQALKTLGYTLLTFSKLMAPFTPFLTEAIYQKLSNNKESVHLEDWPKRGKMSDEKILVNMDLAKWVASSALEERARAGIPVRQALQELKINGIKLEPEYLEIIKDEINVKEVKIGKEKERSIKLNTGLTPELKREGMSREIIRHFNAMRKEQGLTIKDRIDICVETDSEEIKKVFEQYGKVILKNTLAENFILQKTAVDLEKVLEFNGKKIWLGIKKRY